MPLAARRRHRQASADYWPGFVDAIATLLLVIIFLLSIFMLAQFLLAREITGRDTALSKLRTEVSELTELLSLERVAKETLGNDLAALRAVLATSESEQTKLRRTIIENQIKQKGNVNRLANASNALSDERRSRAQALSQIEVLNQQITALRRQLSSISSALESSEKSQSLAKLEIKNLGQRLNAALAKRVKQLARYRSVFFEKLSKILQKRSDIRVVGDRFVFQSEVLFAKGEANINDDGLKEISKLAVALIELQKQIPDNINWVLRVDGHTDTDPINTEKFPSNWELSAARAIAVVRQLIADGVPANRLVAAGFGEFQPLDSEKTEEAYKHNRRIELKLTEK